MTPNVVLHNGKITTLDKKLPQVSAMAIAESKVLAIGTDDEIMKLADNATQVIDLNKRRVLPGLNDSHLHIIRGGLHFNMELRWDGVPSLSIAMAMLKTQADRTPAPQWVRVVGGWNEFQFKEKRLPTLTEINQAAPDTPVFILHLYGFAMLNRAALRALGYDKNTLNPAGGEIQKDSQGNPTGLLIARPNALVLYAALAKGPLLSLEDQINSTRHFMRELNRLGITSAIDAGGGKQFYPQDYKVIQHVHEQGWSTVRIAYNLFAQTAGKEYQDFANWIDMIAPGAGDSFLQMNGAGENIVWTACDFENFQEPQPELGSNMEMELETVMRLLVEKRWPFRIHATYDESINHFLNVFERVNRDIPFNGIRWFFDHAETVSQRNIERTAKLGGGFAIQDRMAFQGEYFIQRYGQNAADATPPIRKMLAMGIPVGAGTDATRVSSFNPWISLYWLASGKTVGGTALSSEKNRLSREAALRLYTSGSAWFSGEQQQKGMLSPGQFADLAVLSDDFFTIEEEAIKQLVSVLTIVDGKIVYAAQDFNRFDPPLPPISPDWSPVGRYGGYYQEHREVISEFAQSFPCVIHGSHHHPHSKHDKTDLASALRDPFWGSLGCTCFAF